jgi:hypothetical protein
VEEQEDAIKKYEYQDVSNDELKKMIDHWIEYDSPKRKYLHDHVCEVCRMAW